VFFCYQHGVLPAQRIVNTFPEPVRSTDERLILAEVIITMKSGDMAHAKHLLVQHFGPFASQLEAIQEPDQNLAQLGLLSLVLAVVDEEPIDDVT